MTDDDTGRDSAGQHTSTPTPLVTETLTPLSSAGSSTGSSASTVAGIDGIDFSTMDIIEAVDLIMFLLNDDGEADLRAMLVEMQAINKNKQKLRHLVDQVTQEGQRLRHADTSDTAAAYTALVTEAQQAIEDRLDALSELSEMAAQRLQMAIDRRSKFLSTLANIMKKLSDTDTTIAQNLK